MTQTAPDAVVITNRAGYIQSMNATAEVLLAVSPARKVRPRALGVFFVKGRVALQKALRDVHPGGKPVERDAWILPTGRGLEAVTVSLTSLDDGFRWVVRPTTPASSRRVRAQALRNG